MSHGHKVAALSLTVALALAGMMDLLWLPGGGTPSAHADSPHRVAPDCTGIPPPCHTTIQEAVDAASPGDVIKVVPRFPFLTSVFVCYNDIISVITPFSKLKKKSNIMFRRNF
jgi:hypothetical protein